MKVGQEKGNGLMLTWAGDIANHFWYCCEKADGSVESLIQQTEWFVTDSPAHVALRRVVLNKRFMNTLKYYVNFRHTGALEAFHNHILMYAAKRFAFSFPVYRARNFLAAIDYQKHKDLPLKTNSKGHTVYHKVVNKREKMDNCAGAATETL
ncbi:hypothetical protein LSAT2_030882 [Lamellibrachia satsuma]|nr:hypothetical protein LSAT2_030882 [Lamellibrachia satsuma]